MASVFRIFLSSVLGAMPLFVGGCRGDATPPPSPAPTASDSDDPAEKPLPRPEVALAYLQAALKDKSRLVEVFDDRGLDGPLDNYGRGKLRKAVPDWWKDVEVVSPIPKPGESPFRVTPDMGIRIYAPGTAVPGADPAPIGQPDLLIMIYKARRNARLVIADPTAGPLNQAVYVIPSTDPMDWVKRLFAGKL
jgi:hypothetical protein